jgi:hypothetical protein
MPINAPRCSSVRGKARVHRNVRRLCGGFIIDGDQIMGKFARCKIKARKDKGPNVNLIAACATDIMLSSVQFSVKELDANSIARLFPGMEDMEIRYHRCPSP